MLIVSTEHMTGRKQVPMNYANYWTKIVERYHIMLAGWPQNVKFANPSDIATLPELKRLRDALKWKKCHWVRLTAAQVAEQLEKNNVATPAAEAPAQQKNKRTRKGKGQDKENARPAKAPKCLRKSTASTFKSAATISSSADESDSSSLSH